MEPSSSNLHFKPFNEQKEPSRTLTRSYQNSRNNLEGYLNTIGPDTDYVDLGMDRFHFSEKRKNLFETIFFEKDRFIKLKTEVFIFFRRFANEGRLLNFYDR